MSGNLNKIAKFQHRSKPNGTNINVVKGVYFVSFKIYEQGLDMCLPIVSQHRTWCLPCNLPFAGQPLDLFQNSFFLG
jgi:hypothetical protein